MVRTSRSEEISGGVDDAVAESCVTLSSLYSSEIVLSMPQTLMDDEESRGDDAVVGVTGATLDLPNEVDVAGSSNQILENARLSALQG
ncbi:hypothetical protein NECAME_11149 [Necator americanus]|uniref:Uncharacterized protein n=1 Tax=Necator americanus TaxID=51031 RepID=W2T804_NECAM|nr:hypothetical protein NECAME_11149 [Necator americanus]ETN77276.1 hypothetical protein NECAME_11149 [Necator americanus]